MRKILFVLCISLLSIINVRGQISIIGLDTPPESAGLLQIRDKKVENPKKNNETAVKGGFLLPRVKLEDINSLQPLVMESDPEYNTQKQLHTGAMVYNTATDESKMIYPGIYTWNGQVWSYLVKNTKGDEQTLDILPASGILTYPSGMTPEPLVTQAISATWTPIGGKCSFGENQLLNGGIQIASPDPLPVKLTGGSYTLNLGLKSMTTDEITNDPFKERASYINISVSDIDGFINKKVLVKQTHYSILVEKWEDTPELGKSYAPKIRANTKWVAEITKNAQAVTSFTASGNANTTLGVDFAYTLTLDDAYEGKEVEVTFFSVNDTGLKDNKVAPVVKTFHTIREYPNTYMMKPNTTIEIPIKKLYQVWKEEFNDDLTGINWTVELLWQNHKSLIKNVSFSDGDKGQKTLIKVETNPAKQGSAVFAVKNISTGKVYWSWQIWVTDYNPNKIINAPADFDAPTTTRQAEVESGKLYGFYNKTYKTVWMDRYLGAESSNAETFQAIGYYYQWGRKDPMPRCQDNTIVETSPLEDLYDINNTKLAPTNLINVSESEPNMLLIAIQNPTSFIVGKQKNDRDWYCAEAGVNRNDLWDGTKKTIYDPCPEGWRVPMSAYGKNGPFYTLTGGTTIRGVGNKVMGTRFKDAGDFSLSGQSSGNRFLLRGTNFWSANVVGAYGGFMYTYDGIAINSYPRQNGYPIKCIRDDKK